jgi:hypothetical protein
MSKSRVAVHSHSRSTRSFTTSNTHPNGEVGHQHIDFIYYAHVSSRTITPVEGEVDASEWRWYTQNELKSSNFDSDTVQMGIEAIEKIESPR